MNAGALLGELSERKVMGGGDEGRGAVRSELDVLEAEESEPGEEDGGEGDDGILFCAHALCSLLQTEAEQADAVQHPKRTSGWLGCPARQDDPRAQ